MVSEGGSLILAAVRGPTGWTAFFVVNDERPPSESSDRPSVRVIGPVESWEAALKLLDRFVWHVLDADYVHPDFRRQVIAIVRERAADKDDAVAEIVDDWLPAWERACSLAEKASNEPSE
jgi:hypothetical protein